MDIPVERPNPYPGPRAFTRSEVLFGRQADILDLIDQLVVDRVVALYAPPGAGVTSLIQAGLVRELESQGYRVLPTIRTTNDVPSAGVTDNPGNPYILSTILSLEQVLPVEEQLDLQRLRSLDLPEYLDLFDRRREAGQAEAGSLAAQEMSPGDVYIFDQLEKLLTYALLNQVEVEEFFTQLAASLSRPGRFVLLALHEDQVGVLDSYRSLFPNRLRSTYRLNFLNVEQALEAVRRPAEMSGVGFLDEAAQRLVDDLRRVAVERPDGTLAMQAGPVVAPIQLQVACSRLWASLPQDCVEITVEDLARIGDQSQALRDYYEDILREMIQRYGVRERLLRAWFSTKFISRAETHRRVMMGAGASAGMDNQVVRALVDSRVLRMFSLAGVSWFELASDQLIQPVLRSNREWLERNPNPLSRDSALWQETGRDASYLLTEERLEEAQRWAVENPDELNPEEREFLDDSVEMARRRKPYKIVTRQLRAWQLATVGIGVAWALTLVVWIFTR